MFFRFLTLFLIFLTNVVYSLNLKHKHRESSDLILKEPKFCAKTPKTFTHCAAFINGAPTASTKQFVHSRNKVTIHLRGESADGDNLTDLEPGEARAEGTAQDSTANNLIAATHSDKNEHRNTLDSKGGVKEGVSELLEAALKWETVKVPNPYPETTPREIAEVEKKFLQSMEESEATFNQIIKRAVKEKEAQEAKKRTVDDSWREVIEEFTIDVEGKKCYGCGATLQCRDAAKRGFVAAELFNSFSKSNLVRCKRCSSLSSGTFFSEDHAISGSPDSSNGPFIPLKEEAEVPDKWMQLSGPKPVKYRGNRLAPSRALGREQEVLTRIKEASTETVTIVRNMLKIKKRKRITILYIIDAIDPHVELGLLQLIKSRQDQARQAQQSKDIEANQDDGAKGKRHRVRGKRPDGGVKFYLVVNKIDLLPRHRREDVVQYFCRMINSKVDINLKSRNVFLISSKLQVNINQLLSTILTEAKKLQNQVLFIGPTNSGKSTLINTIHNVLNTDPSHGRSRRRLLNHRQALLQQQADGSAVSSDPKTMEAPHSDPGEGGSSEEGPHSSAKPVIGKKVTSSIVPGTTLGVLGITLGPGLKVYDTPGIFVPDSLVSYLDPAHLKRVIVNSVCSNKPMRIARGRSILIDKYVRIDVTGGRDFFVKYYLSNRLDVFVKKTHLLPEFIRKQFPNEPLYYPSDSFLDEAGAISYPGEDDSGHRSDPVPGDSPAPGEYVMRKFEVVLEGWHAATCDLVIKGLGFLTLGGALKLNFSLFTHKNVQLSLRRPLLPKNVFPFTPRKS